MPISVSPSETETLLQPELRWDSSDQREKDRPVQLDTFRRNVRSCKALLGLALPLTLVLEAARFILGLTQLPDEREEDHMRRLCQHGQLWMDIVGVTALVTISFLFFATLIHPIAIKGSPRLPELLNLDLHRTLCQSSFVTLLAIIILHPLPGIIYTVITHISSPSIPSSYSTTVYRLRTASLLISLFAVGCMRRGPKLYYPPPKIGTGFGLNEEKNEDDEVVIKLTPAEDENEPLPSAITIDGQDADDIPPNHKSNVFDYANCSMLDFVFLSYIAPLARASMKKESLSQSDLPLIEEQTRDNFVPATMFSAEHKQDHLLPSGKVTNWTLLKTLWSGRGPIVFITFILEMFRNLVSFVQIGAMHEIIQSFNQPPGSDKSHAYLMCWGLLFGQSVEVLLAAYCAVRENYMLHIPVLMTVRSMLFAKILRTTDAKAMEAHNVKDNDKDSSSKGRSQVMNLLTIDAGIVASLANYTWGFANGLITLMIAIGALYSMLGISAFVGIACIPLSTPMSSWIGKYIYQCDVAWARARDARTGALKEFLMGIKVIKLNAFEPYFLHRIRQLRLDEVKWQRWRYTLGTFYNIVFEQLPLLAMLVTFTVHTKIMHRKLDPATAFVALNIFNRVKEIDEERWENVSNKIVCENATISWPSVDEQGSVDQATFRLTDVDFEVPEGRLTLLCGPLGSGKTLLLRAFLGEAKVQKGAVLAPRSLPDAIPLHPEHNRTGWTTEEWMTDSVSYAPQQSFIRHGTIKDNILFGQPLWRDRYREALRQSGLLPDLEILGDGDLTEVGENGVTLSGGQKARVNLARCLYSRAKTVYLDDILSAVDAHTSRFLYQECLQGSLLKDRTIVLVSHHVSLVLPCADYIISLTKDGQVEQACPARQAKVSSFSELPAPESPIEEEIVTMETTKKQYQERNEESQASRQLYKAEHKSVGQVGRNHYIMVLRAAGGKGYWLVFVLLFFLGRTLTLGREFWIKHWTSDPDPAHIDYNLMIYAIILSLYVFVGAGQWVWLYGVGNVGFYSSGSKKIHDMVLKRVFEAPIQFFETTPQGRLLNIFGQDIWRLDSSTADDFGRFVMEILFLGTSAAVVCYEAPIITVVSFVFGIPLYWLSGHLNKLRADIRRLTSVAGSPLYSLYNEAIDGVVMIRAFGQNQLLMGAMKIINNRERTATLADYAVYNWVRAIIRTVASVLIALTGAVLVQKDMTAAEAGLTLNFAMIVSQGLFYLMEMYSGLEQTFVSAERVNHYITMPDHESEEGVVPSQDWPRQGQIKVKNLDVRYAPDLPDVLRGVSFDVKPGQRVGLVGATGSGKSTLALSLFRAIEPHGGTMLIDGIDITTVKLYELRSRLNMVAQDGMLCSGSLRNALDVTGTKDDYEIYEALRRVHLLSDSLTQDDLDNNPFANLDTYVAIEGLNFSQGQRQLLCLARALLKKSRILVMDEATSSVDFEMDAKITATIKECFAGTTMLVIAHRLATIMQYDQVLVLDKGQIVESGAPVELMENRDSAFHALCMAQGNEEFDTLHAMARS
ncbi:hypothetical protein IAR55_001935 [Kwoniella newhampshirensis]|uniref:ATP-dependent bile acid transporter n=1 Tax=Kwoniella newhampshirensis TaxID=1651941 RepID=A0AAW0Z3J6_9TREE